MDLIKIHLQCNMVIWLNIIFKYITIENISYNLVIKLYLDIISLISNASINDKNIYNIYMFYHNLIWLYQIFLFVICFKNIFKYITI